MIRITIVISIIGVALACGKSDYLKKIPSSSFHVPQTLDDLYSLQENEALFSQSPGLTLLSADQFFCTDNFVSKLQFHEQAAYLWKPVFYLGNEDVEDWNLLYMQIYYSNLALAGLTEISRSSRNEVQYNTIEGTALFARAYSFFNLAEAFAAPFDEADADDLPGIPLRLRPVNEQSVRSTVRATYEQIIGDLQRSLLLLTSLPDLLHPNRPSKAAAYGLLSKVYMSMRQYDLAGKYADSCLQLYNTLIDYNIVDPINPFTEKNAEVLYQSNIILSSGLMIGVLENECFIDPNLYGLYADDDLRASVYFRKTDSGRVAVKGTYTGSLILFTGIAVDEIYLARAETYARAGNHPLAMADLNWLLRHRWRTGTFHPLSAGSGKEALEIILLERYKTLVLRGNRWSDIRRLNKDGAGITLTRKLSGETYQLPPNHIRSVLPIPAKVIRIAGMAQNPR